MPRCDIATKILRAARTPANIFVKHLVSPSNGYPVELKQMQSTSESSPLKPRSVNADELILHELVAALWRHRYWIALFTTACAVAAGAASYLSPNKYEATVLMSPVSGQSNPSGLGALGPAVSQLGGLASLGFSMGGGGQKAEAIATLESEALTEQYIRENNLLPILFSKNWDAKLEKWKEPDPSKVPTVWLGNLYFNKVVRTVKETPRTGLVTLTITWTDAKLAAQWANGLVKMTNDYLREKAIKESDRNIAYLNEQVTKTSVVELRSSIYALMNAEIKKEMLARGSEEFALKVIDPAVAPEKKSSPQRVLWVLAGFCMGLLISAAYFMVRVMAGK